MWQMTIWDISPELLSYGKRLEDMSDEEIARIVSDSFNANVLFMDHKWSFKVKHVIVRISKLEISSSINTHRHFEISIDVECRALHRGSFYCKKTLEEAIESIHYNVDRYNRDYEQERGKA